MLRKFPSLDLCKFTIIITQALWSLLQTCEKYQNVVCWPIFCYNSIEASLMIEHVQ